MTERGTTQTEVKVPKCWPNVKLTAPKIDGAKPATDTSECNIHCCTGRGAS